jgi:hypothetical protein
VIQGDELLVKLYGCKVVVTAFWLLVLMVLVIAVPVSAETARVYVDPSSLVDSALTPPQTFPINVTVANIIDLYGFEFKLGYDTTLLDLVGVTIHQFLKPSTFMVANETNEEEGWYWLGISSMASPPGVDGSGPLVTLTFKVTGIGSCALDIYDIKFVDSDAALIPVSVEDGYFENGSSAGADEPLEENVSLPLDAMLETTLNECIGTPPLDVEAVKSYPDENASASTEGWWHSPEMALSELRWCDYFSWVTVAADEEFQKIEYWVPTPEFLGWKDAAENIIERGDNALMEKIGLNLIVHEWLTWESGDGIRFINELLNRAIDQIGWKPARGRMLVVFTNQKDLNRAGYALRSQHAVIVKPQAYWADDNLLQHEVSHIVGARDHPIDQDIDCVMSYYLTPVGVIYEDGWWFLVYRDVPRGYVTEEYCSDCYPLMWGNVTLRNHIQFQGAVSHIW